jgi:hypothetical protein
MLRVLAMSIGLGIFAHPAHADHMNAKDQKVLADFLAFVTGDALAAEEYLGKCRKLLSEGRDPTSPFPFPLIPDCKVVVQEFDRLGVSVEDIRKVGRGQDVVKFLDKFHIDEAAIKEPSNDKPGNPFEEYRSHLIEDPSLIPHEIASCVKLVELYEDEQTDVLEAFFKKPRDESVRLYCSLQVEGVVDGRLQRDDLRAFALEGTLTPRMKEALTVK